MDALHKNSIKTLIKGFSEQHTSPDILKTLSVCNRIIDYIRMIQLFLQKRSEEVQFWRGL